MRGKELVKRLRDALADTLLSEHEKDDLISALLTERPVLIVGPKGTAKEEIAGRVLDALGNHATKINCSTNLRHEDLFGDVDPLALREFGYADERSYVPGIIQKGRGGTLLLKDLDRLPGKISESLANYLEDFTIHMRRRDVRVEMRVLALAQISDINDKLLDRFQVVKISYPENKEEEERFISERSSCRVEPPPYLTGIASNFLRRSREHPDLESGASTRSGIRFVENVCACKELSSDEPDEDDLYNSAYSAFTHSIKLNPFSWKSNRELTRNIFQEAVLENRGESSQHPSPGHKIGQGFSRYGIPIIAVVCIALFAVGSFYVMRNPGISPPNGTGNWQDSMQGNTSHIDSNKLTPPTENQSGGEQGTQSNGSSGQNDSLIPVYNQDLLDAIQDETGVIITEETEVNYDQDQNIIIVTNPDGNFTLENASKLWTEEPGDTPLPSEPGPPSIFDDIHPVLLIFSFIAIAILSTFIFDRLNIGRRIRDSKVMESIRKRVGISWDPLTRLYRNISEEVTPLTRRLEGDSLGNTVKEISTARDELYAERAKDRATLSDIAELVKNKPEQYPSLSQLLGEAEGPESTLPPEKQLIKELEKHLLREGLIGKTKDLTFTHRVSKFLVSDVDERILKRVYDALRGVSYEELPPLPSSDIVDVRKYHRGDSYKDIAIRETIRDSIKRGRSSVDGDSIFVYEREPERREMVLRGDADVIVVLDLSGSMAYGDKLWYAKQAIVVMTIIAERYGNRVGVVGFRDLSTEVAELGAERNNTITKVANLLPRGGTNIAAGIRRSIDLLVGDVEVRKGKREDLSIKLGRRKQIILLTDGDATHPKPKQFAAEYARRCARLANRYGIMISVVCIGDDDESSDGGRSYNPDLAAQIAEIGDGSLFFVKDMRDLSSVFVSEIDKLMIRASALQSPLQTID